MRSARRAVRKALRLAPVLNGGLPWPVWRLLWGRPDAAAVIRRLGDGDRRPLTVVQIGANDGVHADPIRDAILTRGWVGALVEPQPDLFRRLRANYEGVPGLRFVQAAVGPADGVATMYTFEPRDGDPDWSGALGSFRREVVLSHAGSIPDLEERLEELAVPVMTWASLLRELGTPAVDLLHTDTEGYDLEILRQVDLTGERAPRYLLYEVKHLDKGELAAFRRTLSGNGYRVVPAGIDDFAYRPGSSVGVSPRGA